MESLLFNIEYLIKYQNAQNYLQKECKPIRFYACESSSIIYGHNQVILTLCFEFLPPKTFPKLLSHGLYIKWKCKKKILFSRDLPVFNIISAKVSEQNGWGFGKEYNAVNATPVVKFPVILDDSLTSLRALL